MRGVSRLTSLRDISISKKLYFIVGTMAVLIAVELITLWFAIHILSAVRAFVGAEGLWSKAEKDAVYNLRKYSSTREEADYAAFQRFMQVPLGDHKTRLELLKPNPDLNIARQGFLEGRIHEDDIDRYDKSCAEISQYLLPEQSDRNLGKRRYHNCTIDSNRQKAS